MADLADCYRALGELDRAEKLMAESLAGRCETLGKEDPVTLTTMESLAAIRLLREDFARAEKLLRESLVVRTRQSPGKWEQFVTEGLLGECLLGEKEYVKATPLLFSAYHGMKSSEANRPAGQNTSLQKTIQALGELYHELGASRVEKEFDSVRADPHFKSHVLDLGFPIDPFMPG